MVPLQQCIPLVLAEALRRQPLTEAKLAFCWRLAVGPAIERATVVRQGAPGELVIEVSHPGWKRELERQLPLVRNRLQHWMGPEAVSRLTVRTVRTSGAERRSR